jgi:hypothetical protein
VELRVYITYLIAYLLSTYSGPARLPRSRRDAVIRNMRCSANEGDIVPKPQTWVGMHHLLWHSE